MSLWIYAAISSNIPWYRDIIRNGLVEGGQNVSSITIISGCEGKNTGNEDGPFHATMLDLFFLWELS